MHNLIVAGLEGTRARIPASETMANEYVYAKDVGRAVDLAATVAMPKQIAFNIGNGVVTPFEELLAAVKAICPGLSYEVEPGEAPHSKLAPLDISAAKRNLGWEPRFSIATAFADYLAELKAARAQ
jgi:nucleoside-diphosphate-sugar epimerase